MKKDLNERFYVVCIVAVFVAVLAAFAGVALSQEVPTVAAPTVTADRPIITPDGAVDPTAVGSGLVDAIGSGQWGLAIGFGIMLLVWILRVFVMPAINTKILPWIATAIGALGAFALAMTVNPGAWLTAIMSGIQAGLAAAGVWGILPSALKAKKIETTLVTATIPPKP